MDLSNNNNTSSVVDGNSLADDNSHPIDINNRSKKRKRSDESATSSPSDSPGEESREQHNMTLLQKALEQSQRVNELLSENRELFSENRKLRIELDKRKKEVDERDRKIEALRGELGRLKSNPGNQSDCVTHIGNSTGASDDVSGNGGENHPSSSSSIDRPLHNCRQLHDAVDDEAKVEKSDERKLSSDMTTSAMSYSQLFEDNDADEEKETEGEVEDVKQHALDDADPTKLLDSNSGSRLLANNDSTEAMEGEQEQHAVTEYAAAINHGEDHGGVEVENESDNFVSKKEKLKPGVRLAIYWPGNDEHYKGTLTKYNAATNKYLVEYNDGEIQWENLEEGRYRILDDLAFCCQNCTCNKSTTLYPCHYSGNFDLFHRGCCHNESGDVNYFKSPMLLCREEGLEYKSKADKECSLESIKKKYANAMKRVSEMANEEFLPAPGTEILSCPEYLDECKKFQQRKGTQKSPLRVLELFSGIGSGTLALKKLRIPLHTVVHCDHDPIANEVCKFNHNHQRDGVEHVYIDTFEEIYGECTEPDEDKVTKLVADYGPFDLVLAGAPCSNYSGLNANRDASCANAQYLPNVGKLIAKLNDIQKKLGMEHDVLFLSENVVFKDSDPINKCYGNLPPISLDARDFSPVRRSRYYWCNGNKEKITDVASQVSADFDGILDPGCGLLERCIADDSTHIPVVKANTFLASLSKIDDDRMLKYSSGDSGDQIKEDHYSVREREKMMGLPPGYVSKPVKQLFDQITTCAILQPETSADGKTYRDFMERQFWYLGKKIKYQHYPKRGEDPYFEIGIATPIENKKKLDYFKEEQYSKHLIGMGFSICVIESLLEDLVDLFTKDLLTTYEGCDYSFPWEPYLTYYHRDRQKECTTQTAQNNEEKQMEEG